MKKKVVVEDHRAKNRRNGHLRGIIDLIRIGLVQNLKCSLKNSSQSIPELYDVIIYVISEEKEPQLC